MNARLRMTMFEQDNSLREHTILDFAAGQSACNSTRRSYY